MDERIFERVILTNEKLDGRFMNEKSIETFLAKFVTVKLEVDWVKNPISMKNPLLCGVRGVGKGSESIRSEKIVGKSNTQRLALACCVYSGILARIEFLIGELEDEKSSLFFATHAQVQIWIYFLNRLEICQKIYTTEDFRVKSLRRKRVIFDIC